MKRFLALDVFRGMTIFLMIIVNTPGDGKQTFSPLLHAMWNGFTPTDLVFPSFLFAVGSSFAFVKSRWANLDRSTVFLKIFKRTVILFLLGYIMYWFPFMKWSSAGELTSFPISETRILGVLQRIALCYFMAALMIYFLNKKQLLISSAILLFGYWGIMYGFGDYTLKGNFARIFDQWILGDKHLYMGDGLPFDPEGLLSTFPAVVNTIAGYLVAKYIMDGGINYEKLSKILLTGLVLIFFAYVWNFAFPINKKLWTSSYVLLTIGLDLIILGAIIYSLDFIKKPVNYHFFEVLGKNALFIYLLSEYLAITMHFVRVDGKQTLFQYTYLKGFDWMGPYIGSLIFALIFTLICWVAAWWMDRQKIYIKV